MSFVTSLKILFEYFLSVFIWSILNPYGLVQTLQQTVGQFIAISRSIVKGVMYDDTVTFVLPFEGTWKVANGGIRKQTSHSWNLIGQRYAYDFVVVDDAGKTYQGPSNRPENYLAFGKPILAASDGIVVDVRNDIKDYHRAGTGWVDIKTPDIRGNYVVIKHDSGRHTLYAHLKAGSITVKKIHFEHIIKRPTRACTRRREAQRSGAAERHTVGRACRWWWRVLSVVPGAERGI